MKRLFNIAGPCLPGEHYLLPTLERCPELERLIESKQYFVVHAARQSGKTTLLNALEAEINAGGERVALYCSQESVQGLVDPERGIPAAIRALERSAGYHPRLRAVFGLTAPERLADFTGGLQRGIADLCALAGKPLVLLFDEADCLSEQTLSTCASTTPAAAIRSRSSCTPAPRPARRASRSSPPTATCAASAKAGWSSSTATPTAPGKTRSPGKITRTPPAAPSTWSAAEPAPGHIHLEN